MYWFSENILQPVTIGVIPMNLLLWLQTGRREDESRKQRALPEHPCKAERPLEVILKNFQRLGRPFKSPGQIDRILLWHVPSQTKKDRHNECPRHYCCRTLKTRVLDWWDFLHSSYFFLLLYYLQCFVNIHNFRMKKKSKNWWQWLKFFCLHTTYFRDAPFPHLNNIPLNKPS